MELNDPPKKVRLLDRELVGRAVTAILKHAEITRASKKTQLFEEDDMIQLVITLKTIPEKQSVKPQRIAIPHSLHPRESTEVCIFVKDPQTDIKKLFEEKGVKVSKVVGLAKLKANYKEFEAKRKLCGSYDLFLADARITPMLPKLLGKTFFKKRDNLSR